MIYLDNSSTTYPKPKEIINAVSESFAKYGANPGRSGHSFSVKTAMKITEIRGNVAEFFGAEGIENVIFTGGCTEALNLAIQGTLQTGGHVICTSNEHNSVLRPLFELKEKGLIDITVVSPSNNHQIRVEDIEKCLKPNTYLVCVNHISNVDGMPADIDAIGKLCFEKCITFLVDASQSAGHKHLDLVRQHIDLLAIAPHKGLYSPQGVGLLLYSSKTKLNPIKFGGTGTDSFSVLQPSEAPECFESGTLPTPAIIGLGEGLKFTALNFDKIVAKFEDLTTLLNYELSSIKDIKVYTHPDNANGVLSFNIKDMQSSQVADILDKKFSIMVRSGLHCAPLKHRHLKTLEQGTVRASLSYYTTYSDIMHLVKSVKWISEHY